MTDQPSTVPAAVQEVPGHLPADGDAAMPGPAGQARVWAHIVVAIPVPADRPQDLLEGALNRAAAAAWQHARDWRPPPEPAPAQGTP